MTVYSKIIGTGSYLPKKKLTNDDLEKIVDTSDEWIIKRVGIKERRIVSEGEDTTATMSEAAARAAIENAGITPKEIDLIIVATATPDFLFPSVACIVQYSLGISNECPAFDLNAACAGFIYGMSVADQYIKVGTAKTVLLIGVESLSRVIDWQDRHTCVLFGDGAGAVVLQASDKPGIIHTNIQANGQFAPLLYSKNSLWDKDEKPKIYMKGREVFKAAVSKLESIVDQTLQQAGMEKSEIDWLIPHQANMRIIKATAMRLSLPMEKVILTIEHHGNTSAASVPLALDHALRLEQIHQGDILMLEAFGAGFAWGAALVKI